MKITVTVECRNAKEAKEVCNLLSQEAKSGSDKDMGIDAAVKEAGYIPSCERTRLALDALGKCQLVKLADAGKKLEAWAIAYPSVDIAYWITKQDTWGVSAGIKWSTKGWARHLNWRLSKSQDEAKGSGMVLTVHPGGGKTLGPAPVDPAVDEWAKAGQ